MLALATIPVPHVGEKCTKSVSRLSFLCDGGSATKLTVNQSAATFFFIPLSRYVWRKKKKSTLVNNE